MDAHALQLAHRVLGRLRLVLVRAAQERYQRHMDEQAVLSADLKRDLPHRFQERLGLDVADGAAELGDHDVGTGLLLNAEEALLDGVGHVGDDLDGAAEVGFDIELPVFSVGAAGELANVHPQTLRQYDRLGLVVPQRTEGGARRYSLRDISRLAQAQQLSQEEGINLAGITRILELEEENRELRRQVERLRKPAGSSVFAADADGGIVEVERSQRARMWRRQLRADARQLPSRESVRAERAEEGDDMGSRSVVVWGIR